MRAVEWGPRVLLLCLVAGCSRKPSSLRADFETGAGTLPSEVVRSISPEASEDPVPLPGVLPTSSPTAAPTPVPAPEPEEAEVTPTAAPASEQEVEPVVTVAPSPTPVPDTTPPLPPQVKTPVTAAAFTSGDATLGLGGSCESGATVFVNGRMSSMVASTSSVVCDGESRFSFSLAPGADGSHSYVLWQIDAANNTSLTSSFLWTRNTSLPASPTLSPLPAAFSNGSAITLMGVCTTGFTVTLSGNVTGAEVAPGLTQMCSGGAFSFLVTKSGDGVYSFLLSQTNLSGVVSAPISRVWTRDTVAPLRPTLSSPVQTSSNMASYTSANVAVKFSGACEPKSSLKLRNTSTATIEASVPCSDAGLFSLSSATHAAGVHSFEISAQDAAGNVSDVLTFQWNRDTSIPFTPELTGLDGVAISNPHAGKLATISLRASCDPTGPADVVFDGPASLSVAPSRLEVCPLPPAAAVVRFDVTSTVDGSFPISISQTDPATGASSSSATFTWKLDRVAPAVPIVSSPSSTPYTASGTLTLLGSCEPAASVALVDGATTSEAICSPVGKFSFGPLSKPTVGSPVSYGFSLYQRDAAGNVSGNAGFTWVKDDSVPAPVSLLVPASSPYISNDVSLTLQGTCTTGDTVKVSSGGVVEASMVCANSAFNLAVNESSDGHYVYSVVQTKLGVDSSPVQVDWTRDTVPPSVTVTQQPGATNYASSATVAFSRSDAIDTLPVTECSLNGGSYSACGSPWSRSNLPAGPYTLRIRARDDAGNVNVPVEVSWTQVVANAVALFHFDASGDDASTLSPDLTLGGSPSFTGPGQFSGALSGTLAGANSANSSTVASQLGFARTQLTVELWAKRTAYQPNSNADFVFAQSQVPAGVASWSFGMADTKARGKNAATCSLFFGYGSSLAATSFTLVKSTSFCAKWLDGLYHHLAVTFQNGSVKFYVDGVLQSSGSTSVTTLNAPAGLVLTLGRGSDLAALNFALDELRLSQIVRYASTFTPSAVPFSGD